MYKIYFLLNLLFYITNLNAQSQRTINEPLLSRQVHLDFHTSEFILTYIHFFLNRILIR